MRDRTTLFPFTLKRGFARALAFGILCFERFWPLFYPFLLVAALFVAFSWFGLFAALEPVPHFIVLSLFFCAAIFFLIPLKGFCLPSDVEVDRRIEKASNLPFSELEAQDDYLPPENNDPVAAHLWREHQRRMAEKISDLRTGYPAPNMATKDPYGLRSLVWLLVAIAAFVSYSPFGGQIKDAFNFSGPVDFSLMRIDAWVTPPAYTNEAPIYLTRKESGDDITVSVPQGSVLMMNVINGSRVHIKAGANNGNIVAVSATKTSGTNSTYTLNLEENTTVSLSARRGSRTWIFNVTPDLSPRISLTSEPGRILNGSVELQYKIEDDYGAVKSWAEITALQGNNGHALYDAPKIILQLPTSGKGEARTVKEVASHPWAGSEVAITLFVEDGAGHIGQIEPRTMTLPQKTFGNPLARSIAEQRRILVRDTFSRDKVLDMLSALLVRPADTSMNAAHAIVLRSLWTRLSLATNDTALRDAADYMWQAAIGIEGSAVDQAKAKLKQAQASLRDALRNGASSEEIERLMKQLRAAIDDYVAALTQSANKDEFAKGSPQDNIISADEFAKKMQQLENLAKIGDRAASEKLLSELEQMMDNLRVASSGQGMDGGKNQRNEMQKKLDDLSDIMRRQKNILDETSRLQKEFEREEKAPEQYQEQTSELKKKQKNLQSQLQQLQKQLQDLDMKPNNSLKNAERQMSEAGKGLSDGNGDKASYNQAGALDSLRKGAQKMMKAMKEAMEQGEGGDANSKTIKDPLGRTADDAKKTNILPNETDIQRARRILDEIRKKLGESLTPEMEKNYLERLLKFN